MNICEYIKFSSFIHCSCFFLIIMAVSLYLGIRVSVYVDLYDEILKPQYQNAAVYDTYSYILN